MGDAPCVAPGCFCLSVLCPPCALYSIRKRALGGSLDDNVCCMGYYPPFLCFQPGNCGERDSPELCLAAEACFCSGCSSSATRMFVMDRYALHSDPCDRRIIRFNNCVQALSCVCSIAAIFVPPLRRAADGMHRAAEIVFLVTQGCMVAQVNHELEQQGMGVDGTLSDLGIVTAQPVGENKPLMTSNSN